MTETILALGIVAAAGLAPAIGVRYIATRYLDTARDVWLVGLAWLLALLLCWHTLPLGLAAIAVLAQWRSWQQMPALCTWAGIIATWLLIAHLPSWAQALLPVAWRLVVGAIVLMGWAFYQKRQKWEVKGNTGTRIMLAALLALVWPFTSWVEWPLYGYGLWLTSSWVALLAVMVAAAIRYPVATPYLAAVLACVVVCFCFRWTRVHILDRTPRGSSFDGMLERWRTVQALVRLGRRFPIWLVGAGPESSQHRRWHLKDELAREAVRLSQVTGQTVTLATVPTHCEPLEYLYAYGALGMLTLAAFVWHLVPRLALGDPWTASAVAGGVIALAAIPARVAPVGVTWLAVLAVIGGR